jgi:hypothetical protein
MTWLVIAHAFNMDGRAASQTVTDKIPHLRAAGITPIVISSRTGQPDTELKHFRVFPAGPVGLRFDLRHVLQRRWGKGLRYRMSSGLVSVLLAPLILVEKLFWHGETQWSWWWPAARQGRKVIAGGKIDLIYSSGGAYAAHVAAADLKRRTGLPWIAEIHDPMVRPGEVPATRRQIIQADVERLICREADLVFWFTEKALESARQRHPELGNRGRSLLPGVDLPAQGLPAYSRGRQMVFGHFGSLSGTRNLGAVIHAIDRASRIEAGVAAQVELHVYGEDLDATSRKAIEEVNGRIVVRSFGRLENDPVSGKSGRQRVLERMRTVDVLLLHHGVEPACLEYIPSKLYEYLWMQRPILALVHQNPQLEGLLREQGHQAVAATDGDAQTQAIVALYRRWRDAGLPDNGRGSPYTTGAAVEQMLDWVDGI